MVHGTTEDNKKHLASGHADVELSELGVEQAKKLKEQMKDEFDAVFTSDLKRAVDTAMLAFGRATQDKRLRECNYGDLTQKHKTWNIADYINTPYPNGESYKDVEERMSDFLDHLNINFENTHVAIVAHKAPQLALDVLLKQKTWKQAIDEDWRKEKKWQPGWIYIFQA